MHLLPQFVATVHRIFGNSGREWLSRLPCILAQCRVKWGLRTGVMCPTMSINYTEFTSLLAGQPGGQPVALKVGVPRGELYTEMEALGLYDGKRSVRLLGADRDLGALLIQRLQPGTVLWQLGDNKTNCLAACRPNAARRCCASA